MKTLDTYIGIEPFTVLVDDSPELRELVSKARDLKDLSFPQRLSAVKGIILESMINAYEAMKQPRTLVDEYEVVDRKRGTREIERTGTDNSAMIEKYRKIVMPNADEPNLPLSEALRERAGCCRYQGALFFVLAYEAGLGDKHFLHVAPINPEAVKVQGIQTVAKTVFNELFDGQVRHVISIFKESVRDPRFDYTKKNPTLLDNPLRELPGFDFYSYHRTPAGLILVSNPNSHPIQI